jgi:hypothetical protein
MGCAEVVRYLSRYARGAVARAVLIATITPFTLKTPDNPDSVEGRVLEAGRSQLARDVFRGTTQRRLFRDHGMVDTDDPRSLLAQGDARSPGTPADLLAFSQA